MSSERFRASAYCEETDTIRVCAAGSRTQVCPYHRLVNLDATGKWQVTSDCEPVHRIRIQPWFVLPPGRNGTIGGLIPDIADYRLIVRIVTLRGKR